MAQNDLKERSIGELLGELSSETATLVRQEIDLAKAEVAQKGKQIGEGAGLLGGAAVAGLLALFVFTAFLVLFLAELMPGWLAALIVTIAYAAGAFFAAKKGQERIKAATPPAPQTVETIKEDIEWAKTQTRSDIR